MTGDFPCVLPHRHDPDRARPALDGLYVCAGCHAQLEQALAELPAQHRALAARLPHGGGHPLSEIIRGTPERPLPIVLVVADHREDISRTAASWAALTAEQRGIALPAHPDPSTVCTWLLRHLDWACAQPWIDDYAAELRQLRGRALAILYPTGRRKVDIGTCPEEGCGGQLVATVAHTDDLMPGLIECSTGNPDHTWAPGQWHALGRRLGHPAVTSETGAQRMMRAVADARTSQTP